MPRNWTQQISWHWPIRSKIGTTHASLGFANGLHTVFENTGDAELMNEILLKVIRDTEEIRLQRVSPRKVTDYLKTWHCGFY